LKTVTIERPDKVPAEEWGLEGYKIKIDDKLGGRPLRSLVRHANVIGIKMLRLAGKGVPAYEDPELAELLEDQYARARVCITEITGPDGKLSAEEKEAYLDNLGLIESDAVSNEVVGANRLGPKNVSGSPSSSN